MGTLTDLEIPIAQFKSATFLFNVEGIPATVEYRLIGNTGQYESHVVIDFALFNIKGTRKRISVKTAYDDLQGVLLSKIQKP